MLSAIGSIIVYILVFLYIFKYFASRNENNSDRIYAALQLRSPYMYKSISSQ